MWRERTDGPEVPPVQGEHSVGPVVRGERNADSISQIKIQVGVSPDHRQGSREGFRADIRYLKTHAPHLGQQ